MFVHMKKLQNPESVSLKFDEYEEPLAGGSQPPISSQPQILGFLDLFSAGGPCHSLLYSLINRHNCFF